MPEIRIQVTKPGLLTTVQDMGRYGCQSHGVPTGGAMDKTAMQAANWLAGNPLDNPVLEMTLLGPEMEINGNGYIAFTGADMSPKINGVEVPLYQTISIENKAVLSFGRLRNGCRCYMAVSGQWQVKKWMGSCSAAPNNMDALTPDSFIKKNSSLLIMTEKDVLKEQLTRNIEPPILNKKEVEVLPGPEFELFPPLFIGHFFSSTFKISNDSNRMGYRLKGDLRLKENRLEIISSPVLPGTIQIARSGQPVVLMSDAQTMGGYPRFAILLKREMDYMAQLKPGDEIRFVLSMNI
jgi:antagonist of KipI